MLGAEEFGPDFQRVLIHACIDDPSLLFLVKRFVTEGRLGFTDPASLWAWNVVATSKYPTTMELTTESASLPSEDPSRAGVAAIVASAPDWREDSYVREKIIEWSRRQVFRLGFEEAREAWNAGKYNDAERKMMHRIEELQAIQISTTDRGWFFEDFHERQARRQLIASQMDFFPIGIAPIDKAMHGGLSYGELEVPIAYSGIGKTYWCVQRGFVCTRMRRRALHFVLEGGRSKTEDRYEARFSGEMYGFVRRGEFGAKVQSALRREYDILRHNMVVRGFNDRDAWHITFDDILGELAELRRAHGWVPDMIVVDYGDLMRADGDNEYLRQRTAFRQLKALSERTEYKGHPGYAVSSPSQAQRPSSGADEREHVLRPQEIADSYEKVRVADSIISINRTRQEKEANQARVFLGKYRDSVDGVIVRVSTDYDHGAFSVLGEECEPEPPSYED